MSSSQVVRERDVMRTVEVRDPSGHRRVILEGVSASATVAEVQARAQSELRLTDEVEWHLRDDRTGRLLRSTQRLREFVGDPSTQVALTMQPDAALG
jgi:hypothetical protein